MAQLSMSSFIWTFCMGLCLIFGANAESDLDLDDDVSEILYNDGEIVKFKDGVTAKRDGDLVLSEHQEKFLFGEENKNKKNTSSYAGTLSAAVMFWPNGKVPYFIQPNHFDQTEQQHIKEAMGVWEDLTCLKFVQKSQTDRQWIHLQHTDDGCYSLLGMAAKTRPGAQPISLQKPGCRHFGTYLHELGHAIGLVHEHQLPTRDRHIRYYGTNVDPDQISQLKMYSQNIITTYNTPYDLGSIMHYDMISFSVDKTSPTLGIDNPWLGSHIGRRHSHLLSFGDAKTVNSIYRCAARCSQSDFQRCPQPNYLTSDCECMTPKLFYSKYCRNSEGMDGFCYGLVPKGMCDLQNYEHQKQCSKACGFCPIFLPGDSAIGRGQLASGQSCIDRYHEPQRCQAWKGFCANSPWMHRYCRRTCGACKSQIGDCPNYIEDTTCDRYSKYGYCTKESKSKQFIQSRCQDSCNTCNFQREDLSCRNELPDEQCKKLALNNGCEKNPIQMFDKCPSTCGRCYWNKGNCVNKLGDQLCLKMALMNYCTHGRSKEAMQTKAGCGKICNTCAIQGK